MLLLPLPLMLLLLLLPPLLPLLLPLIMLMHMKRAPLMLLYTRCFHAVGLLLVDRHKCSRLE